MKKILLTLTLLTLGLYSSDSSAQLFRLRISDAGGLSAAEQNILNQALRKAEADINKDFPSNDDPKRLMQGMADSSVMAGKGIGSDYASGMDVFLIGGGIGAGADMEKDKKSDSDMSGLGIQGGIILGTKLSWMDTQKILGLSTNKLSVYVNYLGYDLDQKMGKDDKDEIGGKMQSFGIHFRYDWIEGSGSKMLGWGGIKVHTGYEMNTTRLTFKSTLSETISEDVGGGQTVSGTINGKPGATIDVATQSIPIEISTDVRLLWVLSLYTGVGVDFNFGQAKGKGSLNADPTTLDYSGGNNPTVQADANIDGTGKVSSFTSRAFVGAQVNLPYLRVFGQVDKAFGSEVVGATAGVRFVF